MTRLLADADLEASSVVANNAMNRERQLAGVNSYARELGFDPVDRLSRSTPAAWLDLCCGSGLALRQAAAALPSVHITGVDLVNAFVDGPPVELVCASLARFPPAPSSLQSTASRPSDSPAGALLPDLPQPSHS